MIDVLDYIPKAPGRSKEAEEAIQDYWTCLVSRESSLLGRKDVLSGKGKFGIFGDGKEVPQVALARAVGRGDYRSGYYRDQTLFFALEQMSVEGFFAQLYADPIHDPFSGGRQMNGHFATPFLDENGDWLDQTQSRLNSSADISNTAGQMARALGLALASKKYRELKHLSQDSLFTQGGNEVSVCTIGDASTSEGGFWETINAAVVMQVPLVTCVWDDGYGISVPRKYQTAKDSISTALSGMASTGNESGLDIYKVKAWDYVGLRKTMDKAISKSRKTHSPALIHVEECTQPQGHSTSGSHQRYKDKSRLQWEMDMDGITKMGEWMVNRGFARQEELETMQKDAKKYVRKQRDIAWNHVYEPTVKAFHFIKTQASYLAQAYPENDLLMATVAGTMELFQPEMHELVSKVRQIIIALPKVSHAAKDELQAWLDSQYVSATEDYDRHLYSENADSALKVKVVPPQFSEDSPMKSGYEILNANFDALLQKFPNLLAFGEDLGKIGGVNQGMAGLQAKYGEERVFDTGIREWTIIGQAIGMAMRGLRPIAEIQYLDYLLYGMSPLSDDLATVRYRSDGKQAAPAIIRTRGHRLEGIWHSGSPIGVLINSLRGMYLCVPRNMTQAAGFYNTLLQSKDPALIVEVLNGYRLKEKMPDNIGEYTVPLGVPEILREGSDLTLVTYGPLVGIAQKACNTLSQMGISVELIDVQTLLPFDLSHLIVQSLQKTNRIIFLDEDVPGGATAYMMREVLDKQGGYHYLDSDPICLSAKAHRPPYGSRGDYFTKPNKEDIVIAVNNVMHEYNPSKYPKI
ncbi:MAG TPA: transketolase [Saprospiraceae bacterium]|nr:transketolase [Saprospiraceae bacterium]